MAEPTRIPLVKSYTLLSNFWVKLRTMKLPFAMIVKIVKPNGITGNPVNVLEAMPGERILTTLNFRKSLSNHKAISLHL